MSLCPQFQGYFLKDVRCNVLRGRLNFVKRRRIVEVRMIQTIKHGTGDILQFAEVNEQAVLGRSIRTSRYMDTIVDR